jgi:NAD(P)-dependent dehydrogenase (short-subunit alcohol dehydrogenase family)
MIDTSHEGRRRVALVTGASYGIGAACALALAEDGCDLVVADIETPPLAAILARLEAAGARAHAVALDLRSQAAIEDAVAAVLAAFGAIDVLVNNAGVPLMAAALEVSRESWEAVIGVNLSGTFFMTQAVGRHMIERGGGGAIVSIASTHALIGQPNRVVYGISKAGVAQMTRALAVEWAGAGIRVNAVAPGGTETDSPARASASADGTLRQARLAKIPLGRFASAEEIAAVVRYLASPAASYVTGQTLAADGGLTIS